MTLDHAIITMNHLSPVAVTGVVSLASHVTSKDPMFSFLGPDISGSCRLSLMALPSFD